jgi:hypothetical protein
MSQEDKIECTVRELLESAMEYSKATGGQVVSFDLEPEEVGEHVLLVVAVGKEARNSIARILNTFLDDNQQTDMGGIDL